MSAATITRMEPSGAGPLLRDWRTRRRRSQLELALDAGVSARHLSFVETGRARPSPGLLLSLAEQLEVPLRERNRLLLAAGYAPRYPEHPLEAPEMKPMRDAIGRVLSGHEPYPAVAVDRHWNIVASNGALGLLLEDVDPGLLVPPANALRLALHPDAMAPRILNLAEWRGHMLARLRRVLAMAGDAEHRALLSELEGYPGEEEHLPDATEIMVPLRLASSAGELTLFATIWTFGTAIEVTASELAVEAFFPADEQTAAALARAAAG